MSQYLITHSLLNSWLYAIKENPYEDAETERDTFAEFMANLRREPIPPTEAAMQKGIEFEQLVTDIVLGNDYDDAHKWLGAANQIASIIGGSVLQHKAKTSIVIDGVQFLLYGRADALKAGVIYDIKYTSNYDVGKYYDSTQHPMYFEIIPQAFEFTYLVSNGSHVWPETYSREDTPSIVPTIFQFMEWLKARDLFDLYKEKWLAL